MPKHPFVARGFTLIEALLVIAIVGIMSAVLITSLGNGRTKRELETNAREFAAVVREAQNYALTGKQVVAGEDSCRFDVSWGGSNYTLTYWYRDAGGNCTQTFPMAAYTLKNGITFGSADNASFTLPHANVNFSGTKQVTFAKSSSNHVACVYADGRIIDQPGAACP